MRYRLFHSGTLVLAALLVLAGRPALGQDLLADFEPKVTEFTLDNGLHFIVMERGDAPVVSFHTYADVGSVDEPAGQTGIAHMFEHMAFKGTTSIGTTDLGSEVEALQAEEEAYLRLRRERLKGGQADQDLVAELEGEFEEAKEQAKEYIEQNEFDRILQQAGMTGLNASTSADATNYFYSLPANKIELFFATESDRFLYPVLREFYQERDVVMEERRLRTDSNPIGRLIEEFLTTAFKAHPYGQPTVGHMSDLQNLSRTEAEDFFDTYYRAANLTIAIVGDVDPDEVQMLAEKYFGRLPAGEKPTPVRTVEPEQLGEKRVTIVEQSQPFVMVGYHRPSVSSPDDIVYDVLADVLGRGRTSRLYTSLVETQKALESTAIAAFPGNKYNSLFIAYGVPNRGVSPEEVEEAILAELARIQEEGITDEELARAKTRARAQLIRGLSSNTGLAAQLAVYEVLLGDWRALFNQLDALDAVTSADVQRVAQATFVPSNRTVAMIKTDDASPATSAE